MMKSPITVYRALARAVGARARCVEAGNDEWQGKWDDRIIELADLFPSGSGFDSGTKLDESSTPNKLVFNTSYHHMNDGGCYDGWTEHQVIVTPDAESEFNIKVTGRDRNDIKAYIAESFSYTLGETEPESAEVKASRVEVVAS